MKLPKATILALFLSLGLMTFACQEKKENATPSEDSSPNEEKAAAAILELNENTLSIVKEGPSESISFYTSKGAKDTTDPSQSTDDEEDTAPSEDENEGKIKPVTTDKIDEDKIPDQDVDTDKPEEMKDSMMDSMGDR